MTDARTTVPTVPGLTGLSVLARGGHATVYRAVQESVGRDVAVKVENRRLESERDQQRFLREARAAGRMSGHPNVIDLFDAGMTASGHPYLIMELCEGSYADRMRTNPLSPVEARDVGVKIADALADAHALGVLHRDVKPANLLVSRFGEPQLADFGLAVLAELRDHSIALDVLTPAYASPETLRYAPPSPAADVYALCATLYALMRGRPPRWRGDVNASPASRMDEPIPDVPGVPPALTSLLRSGLADDERARPTAVELRDALFALEFDLGGTRPVTRSRRPVFSAPTLRPGESTTTPAHSGDTVELDDFGGDDEQTRAHTVTIPQPTAPSRVRRWLWLGLTASCLALTGAAGWYATGHGTPFSKARESPSPQPSRPRAAAPEGAPPAGAVAPAGIDALGVAADGSGARWFVVRPGGSLTR